MRKLARFVANTVCAVIFSAHPLFAQSAADGTLKPPLPRPDKYVDVSYLDEARRIAH